MPKCLNFVGLHDALLCAKCADKCPICGSYVHLITKVKICDSCHDSLSGERCIVCTDLANSVAHYCRECTLLGRDRDGCPRLFNRKEFSGNFHFATNQPNSSATNTTYSKNLV